MVMQFEWKLYFDDDKMLQTFEEVIYRFFCDSRAE